ncbi:hypothetical protein [Bradyrhizobium sp. SZCCHNRI2007]|uniref:hypothetical protein n=1 Tax=Bradyrhizobium sp. SZCCHNRI2007 TaxID=3057281 RepID=UPI0028EB0F4C|nr:hypothetical protein [Bradyrhizobium sp. SZCCHNRI2007]
MEQELIRNLHTVAGAYRTGHDIGLSTLARRAAGDWRFFASLGAEGRTFTVRKYDEVMDWFSAHWPEGVAWPKGVERPACRRLAETGVTS